MIDLDEVSGSLFLAIQRALSFLESSSASLGGDRESASAQSFLPCDSDGVIEPPQPSSVQQVDVVADLEALSNFKL